MPPPGSLGSLLGDTAPGTLAAASALLAALLAALLVAVGKHEFGQAARRRRRLRQALAQAQRARAVAQVADQQPGKLSRADLARLEAFRARAQLMVGEPAGRPRWWAKLRLIWRAGYAGWIVAALAGAFSMATHFGVYWLVAGGGWPGAIAITLLSTAAMVITCLWIILGLVGSR